MKAWVLQDLGKLSFEDVPMPILGKGETLVKVKCAGICASDFARALFTGAYHYPIVLGHEFSGKTRDGRRVAVFPLLPCFECESCMCGQFETCSNYSYIGSRRNGAFAEYIVVPEWNLIEIPDSMSFEVAAMIEPCAVALHAVRRLDLSRVSSVAVVGNGVIGKLIARWLSIFGVDSVKVFGRFDDESFARFDACVEAVGSVEAFRRCITLARPGGQAVLVGNPDVNFNMEQSLYWQILRKQIVLLGSWNSSFPSDWNYTIDNADRLGLEDLIEMKYSFQDLGKAFDLTAYKNKERGKILVTF